jgi:serine protease Do
MRFSLVLVLIPFLFGCSYAPRQSLSPTPIDLPAATVQSDRVDPIAFAGVTLPPVGVEVGARYEYLLKVKQHTIGLTEQQRATFSSQVVEAGNDALRAAGYPVALLSVINPPNPPPTNARFLLEGAFTFFQVDVYGVLAGNLTRAQMGITWEVTEVPSNRVIFRKRVNAAAEVGGENVGVIAVAIQSGVSQMLADEGLAIAITTATQAARTASPQPSIASAPPAVPQPQAWAALPPVPNPSEIIRLEPRDKNSSPGESRIEAAIAAVVSLTGPAGLGSGFVISRSGYLLTNAHVIEGNEPLTARMADGRRLPTRIIRISEAADLALLQIPCVDCKTVDLGRSEPRVGQEVFAIGTPLDETLRNTLTRGIVSGIRLRNGVTLIQTDAAINPGNSGGPLLEPTAGVVGIVSSKIVETQVEGVGFAISTADALRILGVRDSR